MRISDGSSDVCSSDLPLADSLRLGMQVVDSDFKPTHLVGIWRGGAPVGIAVQELLDYHGHHCDHIAIRTSSYKGIDRRSEEHTSELQSLMRISYAVFCLTNKKHTQNRTRVITDTT